MGEPAEGDMAAVRLARKAPPSLLKTLLGKGQSAKDALTHDGNNASIVLEDKASRETPWTPKSLGRAKTAIIYKVGRVIIPTVLTLGEAGPNARVCNLCAWGGLSPRLLSCDNNE
jgi:hypothetical protein